MRGKNTESGKTAQLTTYKKAITTPDREILLVEETINLGFAQSQIKRGSKYGVRGVHAYPAGPHIPERLAEFNMDQLDFTEPRNKQKEDKYLYVT